MSKPVVIPATIEYKTEIAWCNWYIYYNKELEPRYGTYENYLNACLGKEHEYWPEIIDC